jgi:hypothetical protein
VFIQAHVQSDSVRLLLSTSQLMKTPQGMLFFPCQGRTARAIWSANNWPTPTTFFSPSVGKSNKNIFKKHLVRPGFFLLCACQSRPVILIGQQAKKIKFNSWWYVMRKSRFLLWLAFFPASIKTLSIKLLQLCYVCPVSDWAIVESEMLVFLVQLVHPINLATPIFCLSSLLGGLCEYWATVWHFLSPPFWFL